MTTTSTIIIITTTSPSALGLSTQLGYSPGGHSALENTSSPGQNPPAQDKNLLRATAHQVLSCSPPQRTPQLPRQGPPSRFKPGFP